MFNLAVYGVVDKVLLQGHILKSVLAAMLDVKDFVYGVGIPSTERQWKWAGT